MRSFGGNLTVVVLASLLLTAGIGVVSAFANTGDIDELKEAIDQRKAAIDDINRKLEEYRKTITSLSAKSSSLMNDIALIENQAAMAQLDIAAAQAEIEAQTLELALTESRIREETQRLEAQRGMLAELLFSLNQQEQRGIVATMLGSENFHDAFETAARLEEVNNSLEQSVAATKLSRANLEADKVSLEEKIASLTTLEGELETRVAKLEVQQAAKEVLIAQTEDSEAEYRTLMSELRQEQQYMASQIASLQDQYESKLAQESGEPVETSPTAISWPLTGRITALFHDTTYPFRHLSEHSGLDIAVPVGTVIEAAAPGYVAWALTGRSYGNYVMIIHANGLSTLYAHMSRIDVAQDQYVTRGQQIGLSGGKPGMQGAGLSTGPHLHFEVRKDGIPVNPMNYLP